MRRTADSPLTSEEVKPDDNDEEEEEELLDEENSMSDEEKKEVPAWNTFKEYRDERESISMADKSLVDLSIQILKLFTYLVTFFVVLAGAVLSKSLILLMTSQLAPDRTVTVKTGSLFLAVKLPDVEKYLWVWALLICFTVPELGTLIRSLRKAIFKGYVSSDNFGDEEKINSSLSVTSIIVVVVMEVLHVLGLAIFVFEILPRLDVARGVMLTNCMCLVPGILATISNSRLYQSRKLKICVDVLALLFQITGLFVWPVLLWLNNPRMWVLPGSLALISCGWWMNYVSEESPIGFIKSLANIRILLKERQVLLYRLYLGISTLKILVFFGSALLILASQGMDIVDFFERSSEAFMERQMIAEEVDLKQMTFMGFSFSISSIGGNIWWVIGAQVLSAYMCFAFGKFACKIMIQPFSFAFPCVLAVPSTVVLIVVTTVLRNENLAVFENILPSYLFFNSPAVYEPIQFFINEHGWVWILWVISQIWITFHIWSPRCERLSPAENLFATPLYSSFLVDQSITLNRRRDRVEIREESQTPHIIACATMWHETKPEMLEMLKSLLRMDNDQCLKHSMKTYYPNDAEAIAEYYTFESHIFFDDAFELEEETEKTVINGFVKVFLETVKEATESVYGVDYVYVKPPLKYSTPYGGRLEYTLPGENKLHVHLKDKDKIRHKKRWSQVMYMYYLLGFKLMELPIPLEKILEKAENTFILALDGDIDFKHDAVILLVDLMKKNKGLGAACGRIHPVGSGLMVWYQLFEYAIGHWLQKATEHIIGCVLCSPGCFSLFRAKALMSPNVMRKYATVSEEALHYVQYDQGEDRWLCTLLLQRGYRVEYSAASDAYTHCPETFNEFYTQRRRWIPSTVANIIDLLKDYKRTVRVNNDISLIYIGYQMLLLTGTILGPGTILLMLVGAFNAAFKIDNWSALYYNVLPISIFIVICLFTSQNFQISTALIISLIYGVIMMAVLVGIIMEIKDDGLLSPSAIFLFVTAGEIIIAAILHPQEVLCLFSGVVYYVTIPSMYLFLIIYSVCNLNVVSWGTREVAKKKTKADLENEKKEAEMAEKKAERTHFFGILDAFSGKKEKEESGALELSLSSVFKCMCCTSEKPNPATEQFVKIGETLNVMKKKLDNIERGQLAESMDGVETAQFRKHTVRPSIRPDGLGRNHDDDKVLVKDSKKIDEEDLRNELFNPYWIEEKLLKHSKFEVLSTAEITFWRDLIKEYLKPLVEDKEKEKDVAKKLKELRDKTVVTFFMLNALFVVVIFLLQVNKDQIHIKWPLEAKANISFNPVTYEITIYKKYLHLEPVGLAFIAFFASVLVIQFVSMVFHRFETLCHLLSNSPFTILRRKKTMNFRDKLELARKRGNELMEKRKNETQRSHQGDTNSGENTGEGREPKPIRLGQEFVGILKDMKEDEERKEAEKFERRRSSVFPWRRASSQNFKASKENAYVNLGMPKIEEEA